jgi:hypothetical protein
MQRLSARALMPHLFYWTILLACAGYFRHSAAVSKQEFNFLSGVTDEVMAAVKRENRQMRRHINSAARAYRTNQVIAFNLHLADSLLLQPIAGIEHRSILISHLAELTTQTPEQIKYLENSLPEAKQNRASRAYPYISAQNNALRYQLTLGHMLRYYTLKCSGDEGIVCFSTDVGASNSTFCPRVGELFQTDIFLSDYSGLQYDYVLRVNNREIPIVQGRAHFEQTFPAPGVYPLAIRADFWQVDRDTLTSVEKIFTLNVSR